MKLIEKLFFSFLFVFSSYIFAQGNVTGSVVDTDGNPLPGVTVIIEGTTQGTSSDFDGNYSISVDSNQALQFSFIGFESQTIRVGNQSTIDVVMQTSSQALDEIIVTGYGTQTKRETTGAISTVKAEDLNIIPSGNIEQQFQGRIPGVTVISNGSPGSTSQIRVRGFGAFGGNEPLYIVDGVPTNNIDFLNPGDIESTSVLKDAAAASIYGARAANGVIVMTTKGGSRTSEPGITLDVTYGITDPNVSGSPKC